METIELPVPSVPPGDHGIAWLRSAVSRFANGATHAQRRGEVVAVLSTVDPEVLRGGQTLAEALGVPDVRGEDVAAVARAYHPHTAVTTEADDAVERLRTVVPDAARICILVQAYDATNRLIAAATPLVRAGAKPEPAVEQVLRDDPPIRTTRRVRDGEVVEVTLSGIPFGAGTRACPGRAHAVALAAGALAAVER